MIILKIVKNLILKYFYIILYIFKFYQIKVYWLTLYDEICIIIINFSITMLYCFGNQVFMNEV